MKIVYNLISLLFFIGAYRTYITKRYDIKHGTYLELGSYTIYVSFILMLVGLYFIYLAKNVKQKVEYSKCPKCKETYTYSILEKGICPKCNIKTIDIEKYFEAFPDE